MSRERGVFQKKIDSFANASDSEYESSLEAFTSLEFSPEELLELSILAKRLARTEYIESNNELSFTKLKALLGKYPKLSEYSGGGLGRPLITELILGENQEQKRMDCLEVILLACLDKGIRLNFNVRDRYRKNNIFHWMIANDRSGRAIRTLELLEVFGYITFNDEASHINLDTQDTSGVTALQLLVARRYFTGKRASHHKDSDLKLIDLLVKSGADLSVMDKKGNNALHIACAKGDIDVINLFSSVLEEEKLFQLLRVRNISDKTPLDYLRGDVKYDDILTLMRTYYHAGGADIMPTLDEWRDSRKKIEALLKTLAPVRDPDEAGRVDIGGHQLSVEIESVGLQKSSLAGNILFSTASLSDGREVRVSHASQIDRSPDIIVKELLIPDLPSNVWVGNFSAERPIRADGYAYKRPEFTLGNLTELSQGLKDVKVNKLYISLQAGGDGGHYVVFKIDFSNDSACPIISLYNSIQYADINEEIYHKVALENAMRQLFLEGSLNPRIQAIAGVITENVERRLAQVNSHGSRSIQKDEVVQCCYNQPGASDCQITAAVLIRNLILDKPLPGTGGSFTPEGLALNIDMSEFKQKEVAAVRLTYFAMQDLDMLSDFVAHDGPKDIFVKDGGTLEGFDKWGEVDFSKLQNYLTSQLRLQDLDKINRYALLSFCDHLLGRDPSDENSWVKKYAETRKSGQDMEFENAIFSAFGGMVTAIGITQRKEDAGALGGAKRAPEPRGMASHSADWDMSQGVRPALPNHPKPPPLAGGSGGALPSAPMVKAGEAVYKPIKSYKELSRLYGNTKLYSLNGELESQYKIRIKNPHDPEKCWIDREIEQKIVNILYEAIKETQLTSIDNTLLLDDKSFVKHIINFAQNNNGVGNAGVEQWITYAPDGVWKDAESFKVAREFSRQYQAIANREGYFTGRIDGEDDKKLKDGDLVGARLKRIPSGVTTDTLLDKVFAGMSRG
ncbi:MAG: ankyrin repeat domain-containing protein [Rickettsiales bacterium]|nr:ankyrin repeat domain-containing protein [Rickettsiales bacterium]